MASFQVPEHPQAPPPLLALSVSAPRKRTRPPLDSLVVLLWFELPVFALEIIDAGVRIRQLTLKIFYFLAELLMLGIQFLQIL